MVDLCCTRTEKRGCLKKRQSRFYKKTFGLQKQIAYAAQQSEEDVIRAMRAIAEADAAFAERIFGSKLTASGRSALKRVLEAQARVTYGEMENLSRTTVVSDGYRNAVDRAVQAVQGGVSDYRSAIRRTIEEAAAEGLRVEYPTKTPSGRNRSMRLDSAVRMNVLDGIRAMNRAAMEQIGEEYGADGIEISAHALCAEDHLPYQGKQFSREEFEELQEKLDRPIGMWNCKHMTWPILLGVSECTYSEAELAELNRLSTEKIEIDGRKKTRYEWTQDQRRIETAVRYQKDRANLARHSGHDDIRRDAQAKINKLTKAYEGISEKARLGEEWERMRVTGFRGVKVVTKEEQKKQEAQKRNLTYIANDAKIKQESRLPKVLRGMSDERLKATTEVDSDHIRGIIPKGSEVKHVVVMAGMGTSTPIRALKRLYTSYPEYGEAEGWQKKAGTVETDYFKYEIHWYENNGNVPMAETKTKSVKPKG